MPGLKAPPGSSRRRSASYDHRLLAGMDGDEEPFGDEDVELAEGLLLVEIGARRVEDQEEVVVVLLDLRPLALVAGVLDGERMEMEEPRHHLEVFGLRPGDVDPEPGAPVREP